MFGPLEIHVNQEDGGYDRPNFHTATNIDAYGNLLPPPEPGGEYNGTSAWHSDKSCMPFPSVATFLHGIEVTREGGETLFASLTHAYEALDDTEKNRLEGLRCVHHWAQSLRNSGSLPATKEEERIAPPITHPLIRTHHGNGKKCLYVGNHASHIKGMEE